MLVALAAVVAIGGFLYRATMQARAARQVTEATKTQAELDQGWSALLHHEPEAQRHLTEAYRRDHSPSTAFMLARALQPRLAEQARFTSSFGRMWSAVFSPDGRQLTTTDDQNAQVWDVQSHQLLFMLKHGDVVYHAVYSTDGARLVTACNDGAIRIWDAATGVLLRALRRDERKFRYYAAALSPNGKLVVGLDLGVAHVWDADTGTPIAELRDKAPSSFPSLAFSSDGRWLAMGTGNDVYVFNTQAWTLVQDIPGPGIHSLSWDPTHARLVTGSAEGNASIWAIPSREPVHRLREFGEPINAVAFSPDGRAIVEGSLEGEVQVWDAASAKLQSQSNQLHSKILSIEFDRTSTLIAAASSSGSVAVSNAASGVPITVLDGPGTVVRVAHFDPSSQRVVGASWDGTARIWDATTPYRRWSSPFSGNCGLITGLEPDRRFLAISCNDQPTRIWDTAHDHLVAELPSVTLASTRGRPEERELVAAGAPFADYTKTLKQRAGLRWPIALRRLAQMRHDYPAAPLVAAIETAAHYGLYDLDRLERIILRDGAVASRPMRLYRGLKNPYRPERVDPTRRTGGTDFTDCPAVALRYAQGSRAAVLVVDIDPGEHLASAKLTQEFWFVRDAKRFMLWGRFDQFITAIIPAKDLRTQLRLRGLRNALDDAKAPLLRVFIDRELRDRQLRPQLAPRSDIAARVTSHE